jgi:hypothetical protein
MREWNLKSGDPLSLTLAADARLVPTDYGNDQIWELFLGTGEPPAISLHTTFGLRARSFRMFPRFMQGDTMVVNPADFAVPPIVRQAFPNLVILTFSPFQGIDVRAEYWVPQSQSIAGRLTVKNSGPENRQVRLEWIGLLTPTDGQRMAPIELLTAPVLSGQTSELTSVIFMTGGAQAGASSYPSLALDLDLSPGENRQVIWTQAALPTQEESFALARSIAMRRWDAELARIEMLNTGMLEIYTGIPAWDAAFAMAQKTARGLLVGPGSGLPEISFTIARQSDHGYSPRGSGSDYNHLWNGQPVLEAFYLADLLFPGGAALVENFIRNYLATQDPDGFIDGKPGLAGQRSRMLATPLLANLAWRVYEVTGNRDFLVEVFPKLLSFLQAWLSPGHDRDEDGVPEWDQPMQCGVEDLPLFSRYYEWSQGVDISALESPDLCAYLYQECEALEKMVEILDQPETAKSLQVHAGRLRLAVEDAWDEAEATYHRWDRDTHDSSYGEFLGEIQGPGEINLGRAFERPTRLLVRVRVEGEATARKPQVYIYGTGMTGSPCSEQLSTDHFLWYQGTARLTTQETYSYVDRLDVQDLERGDRVQLFQVNYREDDLTQVLPLWAGIPEPERGKQIIEKTLRNPEKYWRSFGLPVCPDSASQGLEVCQSVFMPLNSLIGRGMIRYGCPAEAVELVTRLMEGVLQNLSREGAFRAGYNANTGTGTGERNALSGLAPLGLFLEALGVRLFSPERVELTGFNPFPWPVTVKYRGMTVLRQKEKTMVIFPDGQTIVVRDPQPHMVTLQ